MNLPEKIKTIALYTDDPEFGGVAQYNHIVLLALLKQGYRVVCIQSRSTSPLYEAQSAAGVVHEWIEYNPSSEFQRSITDVASAERVFAKVEPDLVIFSDCCPVSNIAARQAAIRLRIPYIVVVGFVAKYLADRFKGCLGLLAKQYANAKAVIAVSKDNLDILHQDFGIPADVGMVIHYGRPAPFFEMPSSDNRRSLRLEMRIPDDCVVCFSAARLTPIKGFQYIVDAAASLKGERIWPYLYFVWAGDGEIRDELQRRIDAHGMAEHFRLLGRRWDVCKLYEAADMFLLPSHYEGMPLAIMEAMARRVFVVASAVSGIPEELGDTGYLLENPDVNPAATVRELAGAIQRWGIDAQGRKSMAEKSFARASAMYREELMLERTMNIVAAHLTERPLAVHGAAICEVQTIDAVANARGHYEGSLRVFETREAMLDWLPKGGSWVECGVFRGEFSQRLLSISRPSHLTLIDMWEGSVFSGDADGNNAREENGEYLFRVVRDKLGGDERVTILRSSSAEALSMLPDNSLDAIYVDADHSYEGCKRDLLLAYHKVKVGGWICGHDYLINGEKAKTIYPLGVRRAVDEFCSETGLGITALAMDGYVSYAIHKTTGTGQVGTN